MSTLPRWSSPALQRWLPALLQTWRGRSGPERLSRDEERQLATALAELSAGLVGERELPGQRYLQQRERLGAYLLWYWTVSFVQAERLLPLTGSMRERRLVELGAAGAPATAFAIEQLGLQRALLVDHQRDALRQTKTLLEARGLEAQLQTQQMDLQRGQLPTLQPDDVVVMQHLLNELWIARPDARSRRLSMLTQIGQQIGPGGVIWIIEPALKQTSRDTIALRDALLAQGWRLRWPCLCKADCPALAKEGDWCHDELLWRPPTTIERLAKTAGLRADRIKMTAFAFEPPLSDTPQQANSSEQDQGGEGEQSERYRIVSAPLHSKGKLRYIGCGAQGHQSLVLKTRHLGEHNEVFEACPRYEVLELQGQGQPKGDGLHLGEAVRLRARGHGMPEQVTDSMHESEDNTDE